MSSKGGIACQLIHRDKIKLNLNTPNSTPWNKNLKGKYPYSYPCTNEAKSKISAANKGSNNGMYGVKMSNEDKLYRSNYMKNSILSGKFTPNSNNRNTHWTSFFKNKKYRSSWEALYQYFNDSAEYESIRISYFYNQKQHVYIVDFVNHDTKQLIEIKPKELLFDEKTQEKIKNIYETRK